MSDACGNIHAVVLGCRIHAVVNPCTVALSALQIVVLEEGKVVESGSHTDLLSLGGRYADLWAKQATVDDLADTDEEDEHSAPAGPEPARSA